MHDSSADVPHVNRIRCYQAKHSRNWIVDDMRGPKVFIRRFVFSYRDAAIKEAHRLATENRINPMALFGCQRVEYERG